MLSSLFDEAPYGVAVLDEDVRWVYLNPAMAHINARPVHEHLGRHPVDLVGSWARPWVERIELVLRTGRAQPAERVVIPYPEHRAVFELTYSPVSGLDVLHGGKGVMVHVTDVTDAYAEQSLLALLSTGAGLLAAAEDVGDVAQAVASIGAEVVSGRAAVAVVEGERLRLLAVSGPGVPALGGRVDTLLPLLPHVMAAEAVATGLVQRAETPDEVLRRNADGAGLLDGSPVAGVLSVPVVVGGEAVAVLELGRTGRRRFTDGVVDAARTLAAMAGAAIARVQRSLAKSERRLREALDALLEDVTIAEAVRGEHGAIVDFRIVYANRRSVDGAGRALSEQLGARVLDLYPAFRENGLFESFARVVETGEPFVADERQYDDVVDGTAIHGWWSLLVSRLGDGYLACSRDMTSVVESRLRAAQALEAQRSEREAVQLLQQFALPVRLPSVAGLDLASAHLPAGGETPLGGDWYDAVAVGDGRVGLVIGDVSGHGRDAAQAMIDVRRFIGALTSEQLTPAQVLHRANENLLTKPTDAMVTCCYAVVDVPARRLTYALAGHPAPVVRDGRGTALGQSPPGPPLGVTADATYVDSTVDLDAAFSVVLYTDGLVERRGEDLGASLESLRDAVATAERADAESLRTAIVARFAGNPSDDACLLVASAE